MKILFDISHPAHVHLFRHSIINLLQKGHEILITARNKGETLDLLDLYHLSYTVVGKNSNNNISKIFRMFVIDYKLLKVAKKFNPDLLIGGVGNVYVAHVSFLLRKKCILFNDTEHAILQDLLSFPFADSIITPSCYTKNQGKKQVRYDGFHQLASLHPNRFTPNPEVLTELGLDMDDNIFLVRFAAFNGSADTNSKKFDGRYIPDLINKLENKGTIIISSEVKLEPYLQKYQYKLSPEKYHDLLYFSKMYVGEGSTSAIEAAILGTPAIHFERIVSKGKKYSFADFNGVIAELQDKYHLIYCYYDEVMMLEKIDEIISLGFDRVKIQAKENKERLLNDTIDVTGFMVWFIENYPESFNQMRENPEIQKQKFRNNSLIKISLYSLKV